MTGRTLRRGIAGVGIAVLLAGCGSTNSLPKTPTITAARSCLQRQGMSSTVVPTTRLRPITDRSANVPAPVAELKVVKPAPAKTRLLIAYFGTPQAATTAQASVNPNASAFKAAIGSLEIQQATAGKQHGRVLVIEFHPAASNRHTLFAARYCTTGVPLPKRPTA